MSPDATLALGLGFAGLILHTWLVYDGIFSQPGLNLAFFNALALTSWTVVTLLLVSSLSKPVENLGILILPLAALTLFLESRYPSPGFLRESAGWPIKIHVLLSMLAYSLLTLASVQAILLAVQDHHLHTRQPGGFVRALPPLQTMESLLFEMIGAGFILLTLALASGFAVPGRHVRPAPGAQDGALHLGMAGLRRPAGGALRATAGAAARPSSGP